MIISRIPQQEMQSHLYFASTPNLQSLCTVLVKLRSDHSNDNSLALKVQPQVIRCRELIFTDDNVLASPSLQEKTHIYVIVQQSYWKTGQFQALCKKLDLEFMKPVRVITTIFQSCFSYTLKAKLAPLWNKVGELYIHGRDFLVNSGPLPAVDLDLNVTETEICLALKGLGVHFPIPSLSSFRVSPAVLSEFQRKAAETIPEFSIQEKWSHVLPSLKKGKVVSVTHSIPQTSPFRKYKDLRRYWKNAYGYRLPEDDRGMYFFNIYFPMIGSNIFTYPALCVRRIEPQIIPRIDPTSILQAFLRDVKMKMPSMCGLTLQFCDQAVYTRNVMAEATLKVHLISGNNLTSELPQATKRLPMRSLNSIPKAVCHPNMFGPVITEPNPSAARSQNSMHVDYPTMGAHPNSTTTPNHIFHSQLASSSVSRMPFSFQDGMQDMNNVSTMAQRGMNSSRIVPMFQPRDISHIVQHTQKPANPSGPRIVPTFKPSKKRSVTTSKKLQTFSQTSNQTQRVESIRQMQNMQRLSRRREPLGNETLPSTIPICATSSAPVYVTSSGPECAKAISCGSLPSTTSEGVKEQQHWSAVRIDSVRKPEVTEHCDSKNVHSPFQEVASSAVMSTDNLSERFPVVPCTTQLQECVAPGMNIPRSHEQKRTQEDCYRIETAKRTKTGPVQAQPNVELMAVNNQLHKVNAVTLSTWLKGKNIYVKSREKKADLIQKVLDFITAQKSEN